MKKNLDSIFNVVVGTAGHIDHGKSSLVKRLTGIDPDRLPEEQSRGMTIDLGFAPLTLRSGKRLGIIDVPGHERLIKNMVAGATGIDLVLLIVAADDGVMPQTREHLTILEILGIQRGIVVITKIDLVESDLRELVREEVRETLATTFLRDAPIVEVSSATGEGYDRLLGVLHQEIEKVTPRLDTGIFRMPIQRVFSPKGFGTVVTGIPVSGHVEVGATLEVSPIGKRGRVRGIQAYKEMTDRARAGHSTALNLSDIDYREVHRGMVVCEPGYFTGSQMFEARLRYLPDNPRPLLHQTEIRLHVGTAEVLGKVFLLEDKRLEPGQEGLVQFRLSEPVVAAPGDRYVLRLHSPMLTIGGGEIIDRSRFRLKTGKRYVIEDLRSKHDALGDTEQFVLHHLKSSGYDAVSEKDLALRCGLPLEETRRIAAELVDKQLAVPASRAGLLLSAEKLEAGVQAARRIAAGFFEKNRRRIAFDKSLLRQRLNCHEVFLEHLLARLQSAGEIEGARAGRIRWRGLGALLTAEEKAMRDEIARRCREGKCCPPTPPEIAEERGWNLEATTDLYDLLDEEGELQKVAEGIYFHRDALEEARRSLREYLRVKGTMTAGEAKNVIGSTRKFSIPLLEQLDREGFTVRRGDLRELARKEG
jgi:selenocysteine-specific elongation factor